MTGAIVHNFFENNLKVIRREKFAVGEVFPFIAVGAS
jgi:hypothetical protein